ncbi:MAG: hypothetical protein CL920_04720 [Deltaproteobacteria bacterium]|nr:hypothetical protein [Deltaproteobacteria bacterium]MBU47982.1 hypothetical protein [Deltaproteobacteria bacterium]
MHWLEANPQARQEWMVCGFLFVRDKRLTSKTKMFTFLMVVLSWGMVIFSSHAHAWDASDYNKHDDKSFAKRTDVNTPIHFAKIDYPLLQAAIFYETNRIRKKFAQKPLKYHPALERAAKEHSDDMVRLKFFSHTSPIAEKKTFTMRILRLKPKGLRPGGENIRTDFGIQYTSGTSVIVDKGRFLDAQRKPLPRRTYLQLARAAIIGWMGSPGHRSNLLRGEFDYLGVGATFYRKNNFPFFMLTQNFGYATATPTNDTRAWPTKKLGSALKGMLAGKGQMINAHTGKRVCVTVLKHSMRGYVQLAPCPKNTKRTWRLRPLRRSGYVMLTDGRRCLSLWRRGGYFMLKARRCKARNSWQQWSVKQIRTYMQFRSKAFGRKCLGHIKKGRYEGHLALFSCKENKHQQWRIQP